MSTIPLRVARTSLGNVAVLLTLSAIAAFLNRLLLLENGTILPSGAAAFLHEVAHDARHALGVPCH